MSTSSRSTLKPGQSGTSRRRLHLREIVDAGPQEICTIGSELRDARTRAGMDLREIADGLRIKYRYLEALECGYHSELPGKTYAVGFVRAYGEYLGLNPEDLVRRFNTEVGDVTMAAAAPAATGPADLSFDDTGEGFKLPTGTSMILVLALLMGGGGMWYLSQSPSSVSLANEIPPAPQFVEPDARLLRPHPSVPSIRQIKLEPLAVELTSTRAIGQAAAEAAAADAAAETAGEDDVVTRIAPAPDQDAAPTERVAEPDEPFGPQPATTKRTKITKVDEAPRAPAPVSEPVVLASAAQITQAFGSQSPFASDEAGTPASFEVPAPTSENIQILALSSSWLRIDDGDGKVLIQRRLQEGEIFAVPKRDGLIMAARNAGAFQIMVNGRPMGRAGDDGEVLSGLPLNASTLNANSRTGR
jgi:cytoskeleton protein RodZ